MNKGEWFYLYCLVSSMIAALIIGCVDIKPLREFSLVILIGVVIFGLGVTITYDMMLNKLKQNKR